MIRDCTVFKLAHHGSKNGTYARWLSIVKPHLAVISVGASLVDIEAGVGGKLYGVSYPSSQPSIIQYDLSTGAAGTLQIRY